MRNYNDKPSVRFDEKYGTSLSQTYIFPFGLSEDDVWKIFMYCGVYRRFDGVVSKDEQKEYCKRWKSLIKNLTYEHFPYQGIEQLDYNIKQNVLCGMASGFNYDDVVHYAINGINGMTNDDVENEYNRLFSPDLVFDIQWVMSPKTLEKLKKKFYGEKLNMMEIFKSLYK